MVFGEVLDGKGLVRKIESLPTQNDKPLKDVSITGMYRKPALLFLFRWLIMVKTAVNYLGMRHPKLRRRYRILQEIHTKTSPKIKGKSSKDRRS